MKTKFYAYLFLVLGSFFVLAGSCKEDDSDKVNLTGTTWESIHQGYTLYLKFNTKTTYKFWVEEDDLSEDKWIKWENVYVVTENLIKLTDDDEEILTGTISGNTMKITILNTLETFTKQ